MRKRRRYLAVYQDTEFPANNRLLSTPARRGFLSENEKVAAGRVLITENGISQVGTYPARWKFVTEYRVDTSR